MTSLLKIGRLIDDEDLREKMGKAGMSRAVTDV